MGDYPPGSRSKPTTHKKSNLCLSGVALTLSKNGDYIVKQGYVFGKKTSKTTVKVGVRTSSSGGGGAAGGVIGGICFLCCVSIGVWFFCCKDKKVSPKDDDDEGKSGDVETVAVERKDPDTMADQT